jgi:glutamate carboxypeptidase
LMTDYLTQSESDLPWALRALKTFVEIESPTGDKEAIDECGREIAGLMTELGGHVLVVPRDVAGDHLVAEFGNGSRQVMLLGHIDTVWPVGELYRRPMKTEGGKLFAPGVFDMKAGIVLGLLAIRALSAAPGGLPGKVVFVLTSDEETGSETSRSLIGIQAKRSEAVLVLEPPLPGGVLKTSRKGCGEFTLKVAGVPAHAGVDPERGVSAIRELARQLIAIESLQDVARGTTLSAGVITGGSRTNVIPASAEARIDVRVSSMAEAERVALAMQALQPKIVGASLTVTGGLDRPPFERTPAVESLFRLAEAVAADMGRTLGEGSTGGGSDGNLTAALNVPTLDGLGAVGDGAHALHEHIDIDELPWRGALLAGLIERILAR